MRLAPTIRGRLADHFVDSFIYGNISIEGTYGEIWSRLGVHLHVQSDSELEYPVVLGV